MSAGSANAHPRGWALALSLGGPEHGRTACVQYGDELMKRATLIRRIAGLIALLMGVPILTLGVTGGAASASGGGKWTLHTGNGIIRSYEIAEGSDGALWFTNFDGNQSSIGRITTGGTVTSYTDPSIDDPYSITAGPDGALWFTQSN